MSEPKQTGHKAMIQKDKSWRMHWIPPWLRKKIRAKAVEEKKWDKWLGNIQLQTRLTEKECNLFDHWGAAKRNGEWVFITEPYHSHDREAESFALRMNCKMVKSDGVWNEGTVRYEFSEN